MHVPPPGSVWLRSIPAARSPGRAKHSWTTELLATADRAGRMPSADPGQRGSATQSQRRPDGEIRLLLLPRAGPSVIRMGERFRPLILFLGSSGCSGFFDVGKDLTAVKISLDLFEMHASFPSHLPSYGSQDILRYFVDS